MSALSEQFVEYLSKLADRDRGATAVLRRSVGFDPGCYPPAFPYVERFTGQEDRPWVRQALYITAGLFAMYGQHARGQPFAAALAREMDRRGSPSIEKRFIGLLASDPEDLGSHLRQIVSLLSTDQQRLDYVQLLDDLSTMLQPRAFERRDRLRQRWAREFYATAQQPAERAASPPLGTQDTDQS